MLTADEGRTKLDIDIWQNPNFMRHDTLGWNYRLSEFSAAIALAQLEKLDYFVDLRIKSASAFLEVIKDCEYLVPQKVPSHSINSYWALGVKYLGEKYIGVSWFDFRKKYMDLGGDGIFGAWQVPYNEPLIANGTFKNHDNHLYGDIKYEKGLCPIAESIQKMMMVFKTNYRSEEDAILKADCLQKTIDFFQNDCVFNWF